MKRGALPLNALRAFEATARHGRMTEAAIELCVTHGAVSRQIRALEDLFQRRLFIGRNNNLKLTDRAQQVLPQLTEAFDMLQVASDFLLDLDNEEVEISCLGTLSMRWLIPRLHSFNPKIKLRLTAGDEPINFRRSNIDIGVRVGATFTEYDNVQRLFDDEIGPVMSPKLVSGMQLKCPIDLKGLPHLHTKTRPEAWSFWTKVNNVKYPLDGYYFEHFYYMLEAASAGVGVAIAPRILVNDDLVDGRLVAPFGFIPSGMYYAILSRKENTPSTRACIEWLLGQSYGVR